MWLILAVIRFLVLGNFGFVALVIELLTDERELKLDSDFVHSWEERKNDVMCLILGSLY